MARLLTAVLSRPVKHTGHRSITIPLTHIKSPTRAFSTTRSHAYSAVTMSTQRNQEQHAVRPRQPRIAIVGGGPGGLTLGVLLRKQRIPFTLFELRPRPQASAISDARQGVLDLHEDDGGLAAIRECGLYDEFLSLTGECAEVSTWTDKDGNVLLSDIGDPDGDARPEISRNKLNDLLVRNLEGGSVVWGRKLRSTEMVTSTAEAKSKSVRLIFDETSEDSSNNHNDNDRTPDSFDLVVGADGAWSKIRSTLITPTPKTPTYRDRQCITLTIPYISTRYPHLARLVGPGSWTALGDRHAVISQRGPQDSARLYLMLTKPGEEDFPRTSGLGGMTPAQAKKVLLHAPGAVFADWAGEIKDLVEAACNAEQETLDNHSTGLDGSGSGGGLLDIRPMYQLPDDAYPWPHNPCATLIGDAAHLTLPAGNGVNMAMFDALGVSRAIGQAWNAAASSSSSSEDARLLHEVAQKDGPDAEEFQKALAPLLAQFETEMWTRAEKGRFMADWLQDLMFGSDDSAKRVADVFTGKTKPPFET